MTWFYKGMLQDGAGKADSLRQSKLELLRTRYRHPYFWAAFVMYGE
jgi:CHAT domain-containing protein